MNGVTDDAAAINVALADCQTQCKHLWLPRTQRGPWNTASVSSG